MQGFYKVVLPGFIPCGFEGLGGSPKSQEEDRTSMRCAGVTQP